MGSHTFLPESDEATLLTSFIIVIAAALLIVVLTKGGWRTDRRRPDSVSVGPADPPWARPPTSAGDGLVAS